MEELIRIIMVFFGGIGFSIMFNVHGYRLFLNAAGAVAAWILYLAAFAWTADVFWSYFIATLITAIICEILARITRTPTTLMIVPMVVPPLVPGGDLYNTFYNLIKSNEDLAIQYGIRLVLEIAAINFGIILAATLVKLYYYGRGEHRKMEGKRCAARS